MPIHSYYCHKIDIRRENSIEVHHVTTKDGYVLPLYNIPPRGTNSSKPKIIFLCHALTASAAQFTLYNNISAAYFFSDHGYDVWMGNSRGVSSFSALNHTFLDPSSADYWQFSWHEIGMPSSLYFRFGINRN